MDIKHCLQINAKPEMIYSALISPHGLHSWFGSKGSVGSKTGDTHVLNYVKEGASKTIHLQIEELTLNKKVVWKCTDHEYDIWLNTVVSFDIATNGELHFSHSNFDEKYQNSKRYVAIVKAWDYFMKNLKEFCETGISHPW